MNDEEIIDITDTEEPIETTNESSNDEPTPVDEEIVKMRIAILGNSDDSSLDNIFRAKLDDAKCIALYTLFPFDDESELPDTWRMRMWVVRCAIELYNKKDSANVQSYSENGISVSYLSGLISKSLLDELIPKAGVPK